MADRLWRDKLPKQPKSRNRWQCKMQWFVCRTSLDVTEMEHSIPHPINYLLNELVAPAVAALTPFRLLLRTWFPCSLFCSRFVFCDLVFRFMILPIVSGIVASRYGLDLAATSVRAFCDLNSTSIPNCLWYAPCSDHYSYKWSEWAGDLHSCFVNRLGGTQGSIQEFDHVYDTKHLSDTTQ